MLAVDIGNSSVKIGGPDPQGAWTSRRVETGDLEGEVLRARGGEVGICSVVPALTRVLLDAMKDEGLPAPFVVSHRIRLPFEMAYRTPETLGNDRIAASAAAVLEYGREGEAVVAVDAGTALTLEAVDSDRVYRGGIIAPGPDLLRKAMARGTAQLPEVEGSVPEFAIGQSTREAIRSGVFWGFVEGARGMIRRLQEEIGEDCRVVATGGWAPLLADHCPEITVLDPYLVLRGVAHLRDLNR